MKKSLIIFMTVTSNLFAYKLTFHNETDIWLSYGWQSTLAGCDQTADIGPGETQVKDPGGVCSKACYNQIRVNCWRTDDNIYGGFDEFDCNNHEYRAVNDGDGYSLMSWRLGAYNDWGWFTVAHHKYQDDYFQHTLEHVHDIFKKNAKGETLASVLLRRGIWSVLDQAIASNETNLNAQDENGWTLLMHLTAKAQTQRVDKLIARKVNLDLQNNEGRTALILASADPKLAEIAQKLIAAHANPNIKDKNGDTALKLAVEQGQQALAQQLLAAKADPNIKGKNGDAALELAVRQGQQALAQQLLTAKADPNSKNNDGFTPLMEVARQGNEALVQPFIAAGADVNAQDNNGDTPLKYAVLYEKSSIIQPLLAAKADPNSKNTAGETALMAAVKKGNKDIEQSLLAAKADPNTQDNNGETALMFAAQQGKQDIVQPLLAANADPNSKDKKGYTALMYAAENGKSSVVQSLIAAKADANAQDANGISILSKVKAKLAKKADDPAYQQIAASLQSAEVPIASK